MGWYAEAVWNVTFKDEESLAQAARELLAIDGLVWSQDAERAASGLLTPREMIEVSCKWHDDGEPSWDGLTYSGWFSGSHSQDSGPEPDYRFWNEKTAEHQKEPIEGARAMNFGGLGAYSVLAKHATGTIDWVGEADQRWRVRLFGDGTWKTYDGEVVYLGDPGE